MTIYYTKEFEKNLRKLKRTNSKLFHLTIRKIQFFSQNPLHPSLRLHKLGGGLKNYFSFSTAPNLRIIFSWKNASTVLFYKLGTHDEVYQKN